MALTDDLATKREPEEARVKRVREFGAGFIEAHRQKIFLGLSVAGTLLRAARAWTWSAPRPSRASINCRRAAQRWNA